MADSIVQFVQTKPLWVLCFVMTAFIIFLTEFTSNTASAALIMPIVISVAQSMNLPPYRFSRNYRLWGKLCIYVANRYTA